MINKSKNVCVLFSGGSDSTLTAALLAKDFKNIHLLTFKFSGIVLPEKSSVNAMRLKNFFKNTNFLHKIIDVDKYFKNFYYEKFFTYFKKYGLYVENICVACKMAMITGAIEYAFQNQIFTIASGANKRSRFVFADQMEPNITLLRKILKNYGFEYLTPVYEIERSDWELYKMGITPVKDIKYPSPIAYKNQPGCYYGKMHSIYVHGYFFPIYGRKKFLQVACKHFKDKIEILKTFLEKFKIHS